MSKIITKFNYLLQYRCGWKLNQWILMSFSEYGTNETIQTFYSWAQSVLWSNQFFCLMPCLSPSALTFFGAMALLMTSPISWFICFYYYYVTQTHYPLCMCSKAWLFPFSVSVNKGYSLPVRFLQLKPLFKQIYIITQFSLGSRIWWQSSPQCRFSSLKFFQC